MSYYHYTKGCYLGSIVKDGIIMPSTALVEKKEKPAVWLSKNPEWEIACNIGIIINGENLIEGQSYSLDEIDSVTATNDYMKKEIGMCRILISETLPTISWAKFKYISGISEIVYNAIDRYSKNIGCPVDQWLCTFIPISKEHWEGIEMFVDDKWIRWDEKISIEKFIEVCLSCNKN